MNTESSRVGVVGLGYVGLPLALAMHDAGYTVVGVDIDETTIERLQSGESTVKDVSDADVSRAVEQLEAAGESPIQVGQIEAAAEAS